MAPTARKPAAPKPAKVRPPVWAAAARKLTGAAPEQLERRPFAPQLAHPAKEPPVGAEWIHEVKFDGYRLIGGVVDGRATLWSRNGLNWTAKLPAIASALEGLNVTSAAFDGELIAAHGTRADFGLLQAAFGGRAKAPLAFVLFDLLHLDGYSLEQSPLRERKDLLKRLLIHKPAFLALSTHVAAAAGHLALEHARSRGFEGIVSKRADRPYIHDRSHDWLKTKVVETDEFAVVGYTRNAGAKTGFSSLLLARRTDEGWVYAGRVGAGISDALIRELAPLLSGGQSTPTVQGDNGRASLRRAVWFGPRLVVEISSRGTSRSGVLRRPSFKRVRKDRTIDEL